MAVHYGGRGPGHLSRWLLEGNSVPENHTDGLISEWLFAEGSGTTVADAVGSNSINLTTPTTPNYTWNSRGIALANGLIQTPSITGARTVAMLYKTKRGSTAGFLISGGSASGAGVLQESTTIGAGFAYHAGNGIGVHPLKYRDSTGANAYELNRGGYILVFEQFDVARNTILGLGGRHSTTTSRCDEFEVMWAGVWNDTLTDAERSTIYNYVAYLAKGRGVYLKNSDCPISRRAVLLGGESTADGRSLISELSAGDQAQTFSKTYIQSSNGAATGTDMIVPDVFDLGVNQQITSPATQFGPELGFAQAIENGSEDICIIKLGQGSTFMAPADARAVNDPPSTSSWNASGLPSAATVWKLNTLVYDAEQASRLAGVGLSISGAQFLIGLNDAQNVAYTVDAATYQGYLSAMFEAIKTYVGLTALPIHMVKCHNNDPSSDATALGHIRAAQAAFAAAWADGCTLYDADALGLNADSVHFNAASSLVIGEAGYAELLA